VRRLALALAVLCAPGLVPGASAEHPATTWALQTIDAERLKTLIDRGQRLVIVDVRSPEEFRSGHIPGARSLSLDEPGEKFRELPRLEPIVLYCDCPMAEIGPAYQFLRYSGYTRVFVLHDGLAGWVGRGYPTAR
jgi:rhodanese-related sulfurtransferase